MDVLTIMLNTAPTIDREKAKEVVGRKLDQKLIKQREQGGRTLDYISGSTVIRLLNEAFNGTWSFEIVSKEIVESIAKVNKKNNQTIDQPPYVEILGRLTVPGYGVREQYGTKIILGGATEQEGATKSAATDALKKCATLFGVGLELYGDDLDEDPAPTAPTAAPYTPPARYTPKEEPQQEPQESAEEIGGQWDDESIKNLKPEIEKLKDYRAKLGIADDDYDALNLFVQEFLNNPKATFYAIGPKNIVGFNCYLERKMSELFG